MRIAIDTNRYRDFSDGLPEAVEKLRLAEQVCLPFVVLGELRAGFLAGRSVAGAPGSAGSRNSRNLTAFLNRPRVRVLWPDNQTIMEYARLWVQLRGRGTPIPTNDLWIAALALQHNLLLYTRDSHFDRVPQIARA